jgi:hypothetical protein
VPTVAARQRRTTLALRSSGQAPHFIDCYSRGPGCASDCTPERALRPDASEDFEGERARASRVGLATERAKGRESPLSGFERNGSNLPLAFGRLIGA